MGHYLYGIVPADASAPDELGLADAEVTVHPVGGGLAVLRSSFADRDVRPRRAHVVAHDRVLATAMAGTPVLPLRFGTVVDGDPDVALDDLDPVDVRASLERLDGHAELQVRWEPDEDAAIRRVAGRHPELGDPGLAAVDRGRIAMAAVAEQAVEDLGDVLGRLDDLVVDQRPVEVAGTTARVAILVRAADVHAVVARGGELAAKAESLGVLRTIGALPPYSFAWREPAAVGD